MKIKLLVLILLSLFLLGCKNRPENVREDLWGFTFGLEDNGTEYTPIANQPTHLPDGSANPLWFYEHKKD